MRQLQHRLSYVSCITAGKNDTEHPTPCPSQRKGPWSLSPLCPTIRVQLYCRKKEDHYWAFSRVDVLGRGLQENLCWTFSHTGVRNLHSILACDKRISKMLGGGTPGGICALEKGHQRALPMVTASRHVAKERLMTQAVAAHNQVESSLEPETPGQVWWCAAIISTPRRLKQKVRFEFKPSLNHIVSSKPAWATE